ncbi:hypothetical protein GCM10028832_20240 [Streptomyces sparsus]
MPHAWDVPRRALSHRGTSTAVGRRPRRGPAPRVGVGREGGQLQRCRRSVSVIGRVCWVLVLGASGTGPVAVNGTYQM